MQTKTAIEAYGVKGVASKPWRRTFKSRETLVAWLDKQDGGRRSVRYSGCRVGPIPRNLSRKERMNYSESVSQEGIRPRFSIPSLAIKTCGALVAIGAVFVFSPYFTVDQNERPPYLCSWQNEPAQITT